MAGPRPAPGALAAGRVHRRRGPRRGAGGPLLAAHSSRDWQTHSDATPPCSRPAVSPTASWPQTDHDLAGSVQAERHASPATARPARRDLWGRAAHRTTASPRSTPAPTSGPSTSSTWRSAPARSSACWVRTGPARPPPRACSRPGWSPRRARPSSGGIDVVAPSGAGQADPRDRQPAEHARPPADRLGEPLLPRPAVRHGARASRAAPTSCSSSSSSPRGPRLRSTPSPAGWPSG